MNIDKPENSRALAELIQDVPARFRSQFLDAAREAKSLSEFKKQIKKNNA